MRRKNEGMRGRGLGGNNRRAAALMSLRKSLRKQVPTMQITSEDQEGTEDDGQTISDSASTDESGSESHESQERTETEDEEKANHEDNLADVPLADKTLLFSTEKAIREAKALWAQERIAAIQQEIKEINQGKSTLLHEKTGEIYTRLEQRASALVTQFKHQVQSIDNAFLYKLMVAEKEHSAAVEELQRNMRHGLNKRKRELEESSVRANDSPSPSISADMSILEKINKDQ